jgi:hypothetical protein
LRNDFGWLIFGRAVFIGMTLAVPEGVLIQAAQALAFIMMDTQVDGLVKSRFTDDFVKSSKFKARRSDNAMKRNAEVGIFTKSSRLGKG